MAKTKLGSNAIFSGPNKGLTSIGEHVYSFSGPILSTGSDGPMISYLVSILVKAILLQTVYFKTT